MLRPNPEGFFV